MAINKRFLISFLQFNEIWECMHNKVVLISKKLEGGTCTASCVTNRGLALVLRMAAEIESHQLPRPSRRYHDDLRGDVPVHQFHSAVEKLQRLAQIIQAILYLYRVNFIFLIVAKRGLNFKTGDRGLNLYGNVSNLDGEGEGRG